MILDALTEARESIPDAPALKDVRTELTYDEFAREVDALAARLIELGVSIEDRIAIKTSKSVWTVVAILAVVRAAGCYVPISHLNPARRQAQQLEDTGATFLLAPVNASSDNGVGYCRVIRLSSDDEIHHPWRKCSYRSTLPEWPECTPEGSVYVIFTSGTTGRPKGIVHSKRSIEIDCAWTVELLEMGQSDRVLNLTPFDWDVSVFDMFASIKANAALYVSDELLARSPQQLLETIERERISVMMVVPRTLILLVESGEDLAASCSSLRAVVFTGEVFPIEQLRRVVAALPSVVFYNVYGTTETNTCLYYRLPNPLPESSAEIPLGIAPPYTNIEIVDDSGALVSDGDIGEIHVTSPVTMLGYIQDGEMKPCTARYATGDLGSRRVDGQIVYRGRRDTQRVVRGVRIDLLEIERVLDTYDRVGECAAALDEDGRLHAFLRFEGNAPLPAALAIRQYVAEHLPPYLVPQVVTIVTALPRHPNGKLDRKRLDDMIHAKGTIS
ncbi:MAG: amino acid adenylation domain-containing protein [Pseudomonadota bacterium]